MKAEAQGNQSEAPAPKLAKNGSTLFGDGAVDAEAEAQRLHDRQVDLLISAKGHERLRAFGFQVVQTGHVLPAKTQDRRSL